jgi:hypothetical protein
MKTDADLALVKRVRERGFELQRIALEFAEVNQHDLSKLVLRAALKAVSFVPPKPAEEQK